MVPGTVETGDFGPQGVLPEGLVWGTPLMIVVIVFATVVVLSGQPKIPSFLLLLSLLLPRTDVDVDTAHEVYVLG